MKCPECVKEGKKSRITQDVTRLTFTTDVYCAPYWDEEGNRHIHDLNTTTTSYECSKGHKWTGSAGSSCWCGWPEKLVIESKGNVGITTHPGSPTYRLDVKDGGSVDSFGQPSPDEILIIDKHPKELGIHGIGTPIKPE